MKGNEDISESGVDLVLVHLFAGSHPQGEGRVEAVIFLKTVPSPEDEIFRSVLLPHWEWE